MAALIGIALLLIPRLGSGLFLVWLGLAGVAWALMEYRAGAYRRWALPIRRQERPLRFFTHLALLVAGGLCSMIAGILQLRGQS